MAYFWEIMVQTLLVLGSEYVFTGLSVPIIHISKLLLQGTYAGQFVMEVSPVNR